jgi:hypothetical protein
MAYRGMAAPMARSTPVGSAAALHCPDFCKKVTFMKMRASELSSAGILGDGSLSIGYRSSTDSHTLELSRKAQEQLLPALLASEPANLQKFFSAADVQALYLKEGVLLSFAIAERIVVRVLVTEPIRQKLLAQLTSIPAPPQPAG